MEELGPLVALMIPVLVVLAMLLLRGLRQINQWEVALKFTLGKFSGRLQPGLNFVVPIVQSIYRIDTRIRNRDLPKQMVITRDNVTAMIDAVVYFKVVDPEKAALNVENYELAVKDRARVVLRDVVGEITLDELLGHRDEIAARVRKIVEQFVAQWGLHVELIALQDIQLPASMQEAIARKAIAERDKQYVIIKSQADVESARNFAEAARIMTEVPGALELRRLEALQGLTSHGVSKVIFDLARPDIGDNRQATAAMAAAMADNATDSTGIRVDATAPRAPEYRASRPEQAAVEGLHGEAHEGLGVPNAGLGAPNAGLGVPNAGLGAPTPAFGSVVRRTDKG